MVTEVQFVIRLSIEAAGNAAALIHDGSGSRALAIEVRTKATEHP